MMTFRELLSQTDDNPLEAEVDAQLQGRTKKETKGGKPYLELELADATATVVLKVWNNHPQWDAAEEDIEVADFLRVSGHWTQNQYGLDAKGWSFRRLNEGEAAEFLAGDVKTKERQDADWDEVLEMVGGIGDPRLRGVCDLFLEKLGDRFRRTAAAKRNHHARRGGLLEHVAQMMRSGRALHSAYPSLNLDLLLAAILFHDCGKLWENTYPEVGFTQLHDKHGEMLGHIVLGLELVNKLWRDLPIDDWAEEEPPTEDVRLHLLHLIASHHGTHEFGSPTLPKTPEAVALHHIDNLDAKLEMLKDAYETSAELVPGIYERRFPLPGHPIQPLEVYGEGDEGEAGEVGDGELF